MAKLRHDTFTHDTSHIINIEKEHLDNFMTRFCGPATTFRLGSN